ncbi:sulfotransferase [Nisaea sediminum]|uniref:sulfotransferase n=1 Tax=Nisaea sediminum TaxID=2775867 RepID=UPI001866EA54|nr:sulfotransferase [Nisaea sediminum]
MSGALSPERQKLRQVIAQAEQERNVALIKSLMKFSFDNDCFEELLELNRIVERFSDSNRGVDLSRALLERNPNLPSVLIVALPRSGSTYLRDSVINTWGFKNYLCYNSNELGFTECDGLYSSKLGLGGLISRMHSEAKAAELEKIEQSGISKLVLLIRNPIDSTVSLLRREGLENPDQDRAKQLVRQNITWLRDWKDQKDRLKDRCLVLRYEDAVRDWAGAVRDVGEFYGLDRLEPVVAGEQSKNRFNLDLDLGDDLHERIMQGESCLGIEEFYRW